jgi:hypothetical protein
MRKLIFINMIRLNDLLTEITFGNTQPYATQFVWEETYADRLWQTGFTHEGVEVRFDISEFYHAPGNYAFAITTKSTRGWTLSHDRSHSRGALSYPRILLTAFEAIVDFINTHAPKAIDITGSDPEGSISAQKTRIYQALLASNSAKLAAIGYRVLPRGGKLWLVRNIEADSTGMAD